jgi:hypothetical protein
MSKPHAASKTIVVSVFGHQASADARLRAEVHEKFHARMWHITQG